MCLLECSDVYRRFSGQCTQCKHCVGACSSLTNNDMSLGDIAQGMLEAERSSSTREELAQRIAANEQLVRAVRGCFFCTSCKNTCFAHNDVCDLIYHARVDFQSLGLIEREAWSSVLVDEEWDIFKAYRAIYGIGYPDLTRHLETQDHAAQTGFKTAFFPGCALAAYGSDLTREIFSTFEEIGDGSVTMIDSCCGSSLKSAGFFERAEALCDRNAIELESAGVSELVCVCPGCANDMRTALSRRGLDVEVRLLAGWLEKHDFTPKHPLPEGPIYLSKSCQDRDGTYLDETRRALGLNDDATCSIFHGCCGAGGAVSAFDPARQSTQSDEKLSFAPDGSTVVTMCPTCTYTYAFRLMQQPRDISNKHYTELMFDSDFDWDTTFQQLSGMWYGDYGPWLAQVFA